jgi:hypothetical protein
MFLGLAIPRLAHAQPVIVQQPVGGDIKTGDPVTLKVVANGPGPLFYQWVRNGVNIPGATNDFYTISSFQPTDGGSYWVEVSDAKLAVKSDIAKLTPQDVKKIVFSDKFPFAQPETSPSDCARGDNFGATKEPGEPDHGGNRGGKSVWFSWQAPASGIVHFSTTGSVFDTLLSAYTGDAVTRLITLAGDDDGGGWLNSSISFNVVAGAIYHIAVDGQNGASGEIVLCWNFEPSGDDLPVIVTQPISQTVAPGTNVALSFEVTGVRTPLIQWFLNGRILDNETRLLLLIPNARPDTVGYYTARVRDLEGQQPREIFSNPADVQINLTDGKVNPNVAALDKFSDQASAIGIQSAARSLAKASRIRKASGGPATGYTGTQIFNTFGSTKEEGEPNHCGVAGGASEWYAYQPPANGLLTVDTIGSDFDTVLAIYTGPGTDFASLVPVACDNDSGPDGADSRTTFSVTAGTLYFIAVDGVGGTTGTVFLNYNLNAAPTISNIADQTIDENTSTAAITFAVGDAETPPANLLLTGGSSNSLLVPGTNIVFAGTGTNRTVTVTPASDQNGTTIISVTVTDDGGAAASDTFVLTVNPVEPLVFVSNVKLPDGSFRLRLTGSPLQNVVLHASPDFTGWLPIFTNNGQTGMMEFIDSTATNYANRFYRAVR